MEASGSPHSTCLKPSQLEVIIVSLSQYRLLLSLSVADKELHRVHISSEPNFIARISASLRKCIFPS